MPLATTSPLGVVIPAPVRFAHGPLGPRAGGYRGALPGPCGVAPAAGTSPKPPVAGTAGSSQVAQAGTSPKPPVAGTAMAPATTGGASATSPANNDAVARPWARPRGAAASTAAAT